MRLWILGASDPEIYEIERLLRGVGETVAYASVGANWVHPGNAYEADGWIGGPDRPDLIVLVECGFCLDLQLEFEAENYTPITRIDHHRPGDPGYGQTPEKFLQASSLGQVISQLASEVAGLTSFCWFGRSEGDNLIVWPDGFKEVDGGTSNRERSGTIHFENGEWLVYAALPGFRSKAVHIPDTAVFTAAADHCLGAAYRGKCPGVDPDRLMAWRAKRRALFQGREVEELLADVEAARKIVRHARNLQAVRIYQGRLIGTARGLYDAVSAPWGIANLLQQRYHIPELPEAAAREGRAFIASLRDRGGREKVVLQSASPKQVRWFLDHCPVIDKYGDPARGFAGGYL